MTLAADYTDSKQGRSIETDSQASPVLEIRQGFQIVFYGSDERPPRVERVVPIPHSVIDRYAHLAIRLANLEPLDEGGYYASIPGFVGVWASGATVADTMDELREVVKDWTTLKLIDGDLDIPPVADLDLRTFA